jgi:hypothetical protein
MKRTGRINVPSSNKLACGELLGKLNDFREVLAEIDRRGGIVSVLNEAQVDESVRIKVVSYLKRITYRTRSYIADVGDDRRDRGVAVPLCWIPESESPTERPHDTAGESFISQMKES